MGRVDSQPVDARQDEEGQKEGKPVAEGSVGADSSPHNPISREEVSLSMEEKQGFLKS